MAMVERGALSNALAKKSGLAEQYLWIPGAAETYTAVVFRRMPAPSGGSVQQGLSATAHHRRFRPVLARR
jgi:hypothetical protein